MLEPLLAARVLQEALNHGGDFAELFCEDRAEMMIEEQGGQIQNVTSARLFGVGVRVLNGFQSSYTYTNELDEGNLIRAAREAASVLQGASQAPACAPFVEKTFPSPTPCRKDPNLVTPETKAALLREIDAFTRALTPQIRNVKADYFQTEQKVTIFNSEGVYARERRIYCRVRLTLTVGDAQKSRTEWHDLVRNDGYRFEDSTVWQAEIKTMLDRMVTFLHAGSAPSGIMDVVFEKGESSLCHEVIGHPLEGIAVSDGFGLFSGKIGQSIASEKVTLVDYGTIPNLYGSLGMDDCGQPTRRNVLIQNGVLVGYMLDRVAARKLGMQPTGNARRQNYTYASVDRMTNTSFEPGEDDEEEMISSTEYGLYVKSIGGGAANPVTGSFNVEVTEGYLIEHGKITRAVSGMTISGTAEMLKNIDRVGKISPLPVHTGGFCGASSGLVPVNSFQPRIRVRGLVVGGKGEA
jgi:TldD protein